MLDKHHVLQSIVIILLLARTAAGAAGCSSEHTVTEQTLKAIKDCITNSPTPWPDEWKQQYLKTIRKAIEQHPDVPHYTTRLEILRKGFEPYWGSFKKTPEARSQEDAGAFSPIFYR